MEILIHKEREKIFLNRGYFPAHKITGVFSQIEIEFLQKNSTGILQPMDLGIIKTLKTHFEQI